jgi:type I restriction enzyme R subunit
MLQRSIISEEVIDVFQAMNLDRPDISILSEDFLNEIRNMEQKNLAVEMLRKLLEGKIKTIERTNVVKSEKFSEKLTKALNKYRNQALTNAEVLEELIRMAHEIKMSQDEENKLGLSEDEVAFYYALTSENIVKELMEDDILKQIAHELTEAIRSNITIDWSIRKSARASMRRIIKRLLKKYGYPPEQSVNAMRIVMRQAEKMAGNVYEEVAFSHELVADEDGVEY